MAEIGRGKCTQAVCSVFKWREEQHHPASRPRAGGEGGGQLEEKGSNGGHWCAGPGNRGAQVLREGGRAMLGRPPSARMRPGGVPVSYMPLPYTRPVDCDAPGRGERPGGEGENLPVPGPPPGPRALGGNECVCVAAGKPGMDCAAHPVLCSGRPAIRLHSPRGFYMTTPFDLTLKKGAAVQVPTGRLRPKEVENDYFDGPKRQGWWGSLKEGRRRALSFPLPAGGGQVWTHRNEGKLSKSQLSMNQNAGK